MPCRASPAVGGRSGRTAETRRGLCYDRIMVDLGINEHAGAWDSRGMGLAGFRGRAEPIGWPSTIASVAVICAAYVMWFFVSSKIVILIFICIEIFLAWIITMEFGHCRAMGRWTMEAANLRGAIFFAIAIITLGTLSFSVASFFGAPGPDNTMARVGTLLVALSVIYWLIFVRSSGGRMQPDRADIDPIRPRSDPGWSQRIDVIIWVAITLGIIVVSLWLCNVDGTKGETYDRSLVLAAIVCCLYQYAGTLKGTTIGQRKAGVRIVTARSGVPLRKIHTALRTLLLMAPFFAALVMMAKIPTDKIANELDADDPVAILAFMTIIFCMVAGVVSYSFVRDPHARGQGLLELATRSFVLRRPRNGNRQ